MFTLIQNYCDGLKKDVDLISVERKNALEKVAHYIRAKQKENKSVYLLYICTHNSRRSHFGQVWAHVASDYYNIPNVQSFSGGTEATAFNVNAINALKKIGFDIQSARAEDNAMFHVYFGDTESPIVCFSKVYDDPTNPQKEFIAIMTCSDADENCPIITGAEHKVATTYDDPKKFDNNVLQDAKYDECCRQIALETFYVFSKI